MLGALPYLEEAPPPPGAPGSPPDPAKLKPEELKLLNTHVEESHDSLQSGERCESLRLAARVPFRVWLYREHTRSVFVAVGLFIVSLLGLASQSLLMRVLMPLAPLLACVYLGYASVTDTHALQDSVSAGLHACSTALPEGSASNPAVVQKRMDHVERMKKAIDRAYDRHETSIETLLERYKL